RRAILLPQDPRRVPRDSAMNQKNGSMTASDIPLKNIENLSERTRPPLFAELNDWLGEEVVTFDDYEIPPAPVAA
ncbi:hypothetical protein ACGYTW_29675, partial [Burkholderia pseudomallei]